MPAAISNSLAAIRSHEKFGYDCRRTIVIPNGINTDKFKPSGHLLGNKTRTCTIPANHSVIGLVPGSMLKKIILDFLMFTRCS